MSPRHKQAAHSSGEANEHATDPVTLQVAANALASVADEMATTIFRTAHSTVVRDSLDFSAALANATGEIVAQAVTVPLHLGSQPAGMQSLLEKFGDEMRPGDIFIMNDPFDGGIHIPDIFLFHPIFFKESLIGFSAVISHHVDVGGRVPGSAACDNTEIFQDGLRIPPLKLYDRGVPSEAIFEILEKNVRVPVMLMGDLRANLSACRTGEKGMIELATQYGPEQLDVYYAQLLDYTERMIRAEIATWPDGVYAFTDYLDDDGVDPVPIPIVVTMTVHGDSVTIDFTGTSEQVRGGINCPLPFTISCCGYAVRSIIQGDIPNTSGLFRPIDVIAPEASIVNPVMPAASGMRGVVGFRLSDALFGCLAQIVPHKVPAAGEGGNSLIIIGGYNKKREPFVMFDLMAGTWGARPTKDGNDGLTNPGSVISNIPAELMELEYPVRIEQYALCKDTGGAGMYRGGMAVARQWRYLGDTVASLSVRSDRHDFPPYGLFEGKHGMPSSVVINPDTEQERVLRTKVTDSLKPGDSILHIQAGGGGWGNPLKRDPAAVQIDVLNDRVSIEKAQELYGVVIDRTSNEVDEAATSAKRAVL